MMDTFLLADTFMNNLKAGDMFILSGKEFTVTSQGKWKSKLIEKEFDTKTICYDKEAIKFYNFFGWCGSPKSHDKLAHARQNNFLRNIEGILLVDLLNENNKFHKESEIMKITKRNLKSMPYDTKN